MPCPCAFRLLRLAQSLRGGVVPILGRGIFLVDSRSKWPCASRSRRLAQSAGLTLPRAHFSWQAQHFEDLDKSFCDVHVHFDYAGSHENRARSLGCGIFPVNSCAKHPLCDVHLHFDCAGSRKVCTVGSTRCFLCICH